MHKYSSHPDSVKKLFDTIAPHYDSLNHLLSIFIDIYWRKAAVRKLRGIKGLILDIATGTGDIVIEILNHNKFKSKVVGIDFSPSMIKNAKKKMMKRGLLENAHLIIGDALYLPFQDNTFEAAIISFGLRNILDKKRALSEMIRVIKNGGKLIVLELTLPNRWFLRKIYPFYFKKILPHLGGSISGDKPAYEYLLESIYQFKDSNHYEKLMKESGLKEIFVYHLNFGLAFIATGIKK